MSQKDTECYVKQHQVNTTDDCSILRFLSEVDLFMLSDICICLTCLLLRSVVD